MSELVIEVTKHTRGNRIALLLLFISLILTLVFLEPNRGFLNVLLIIPMTFFILFILVTIFNRFITEDKSPEATLSITAKGIRILKDNGKSQNLRWNEMACVDIFDHGHAKSLRVASTKFAVKEIFYEEKHLSHSCQEIIKFVHDICPYGENISFWNERRALAPESSSNLVE